ncbi:hypothetical protein FACS189440_20910 [Bacteroidia bacterium]|nr:hypothetical protein FACS189440_20910 [Bacteroidia bacterium]
MPNEKFQNQYRISSARAQWWNYGWNAAYFITICTANREHYFGEIVNGNMQLSEIGEIANVLWNEIKNHAKNIELDAFCIMPNHVHGILILTNDENVPNRVETRHALSLQRFYRNHGLG